jgi:hypothetical protein
VKPTVPIETCQEVRTSRHLLGMEEDGTDWNVPKRRKDPEERTRLEALRLALGYDTQADFLKGVDVQSTGDPRLYYRALESGDRGRRPSVEGVRRLSVWFGLSMLDVQAFLFAEDWRPLVFVLANKSSRRRVVAGDTKVAKKTAIKADSSTHAGGSGASARRGTARVKPPAKGS